MAYREIVDQFGITEFVGYSDDSCDARILAIIPGDDDTVEVFLDRSQGNQETLVDAVRGIARAVKAGHCDISDIDETLIAQHLYTHGIPDPDLLIRTSGEMRISNFLLWQIAYTEIYVTDTLWPDFREREFLDAVAHFQRRERRFGRTGEQAERERLRAAH